MMEAAQYRGGWDYTELPANIRIGKDCYFERKEIFGRFKSAREDGLVIGDGVKVFTWTSFNVEPEGRVRIGAGSTLVGAVFMCAEAITIGERVILSYHVTIADSDFHPTDPELRKQDAVANAPQGDRSRRPAFVTRPVVIEDDVWVGIGAIILKGVKIGKGARVAPGSVVTTDVDAGIFVQGNPARPVGKASDSPWQ